MNFKKIIQKITSIAFYTFEVQILKFTWNKIMKKVLLASLLTGSLFAEMTSQVLVDPYFSPYIGAEDLLSLHRGVEYTENWLFPRPEHPSRRFYAGLGRFSELFLFWDPLNATIFTTQHEVFGHGYRVRTLRSEGANVKMYKIKLPFPYGWGGGMTRAHFNTKQTTSFEMLAFISGGMEATSILANRLRLKWLQRGTIDARESSLYIGSEQDITTYAWLSMDKMNPGDGNDIVGYVHLLNKTYLHGHIKVRDLKLQATVTLLDPFTWYSLYAWWWYVFRGVSSEIPMIPIGSYNYLPSVRYGLTPFGPEYYLENFLVKDNQPIYFYLRAGGHAHQAYLGFGIEHAYLWNLDSLPWGLRLDCWYQPHAAFRHKGYSLHHLRKVRHFHHQPRDAHLGISLSVIGQKKLWSGGSLYFQLGGKTIGFLPGEPLQPAVIARLGLSFW